jgi:hypothetical protein
MGIDGIENLAGHRDDVERPDGREERERQDEEKRAAAEEHQRRAAGETETVEETPDPEDEIVQE